MANASEAQLRAQAKFDKDPTKTKRVLLKLNRNTDAAIVHKLESVDNMQGYIKDLIRADLEAGK